MTIEGYLIMFKPLAKAHERLYVLSKYMHKLDKEMQSVEKKLYDEFGYPVSLKCQ